MSKKATRPNTVNVDLADPEEWTFVFNETNDLLNDVKQRVRQRNEKLKKGATSVARENAELRKDFGDVDRDINDLKSALHQLKSFVSKNEIARRKDELDRLQQEKISTYKLFKNPPQNRTLFDSEDNQKPYDPNDEPENLKSLQAQQVLDIQDKVMEQQDKDMDLLSDALDRTKQIGLSMSDELSEHSKLLSDIDKEVGKTKSNIDKQTKRVNDLMKKAGIGFGICIIIILVIIIVVLVVLLVSFGLPFKDF